MGGFLPFQITQLSLVTWCFRPLSRVGWFPTSVTTKATFTSLFRFRTLSRVGWGPTKTSQTGESLKDCFRPLSRVGWFPTIQSHAVYTTSLIVSGPSRGLGGFLRNGTGKYVNFKVEFPAPLEGWVVSYSQTVTTVFNDYLFPAPLEGWVVSYSCLAISSKPRLVSFRPLSRYGWVPTHSLMIQFQQIEICFQPLSRYGWVPTLL